MNHHLPDLTNKERVTDDFPAELVENLSTPWLPIECETRVGRSEALLRKSIRRPIETFSIAISTQDRTSLTKPRSERD